MNADQRDKLLDLHRAAVKEEVQNALGLITAAQDTGADDAFRAFLFSLEVTA